MKKSMRFLGALAICLFALSVCACGHGKEARTSNEAAETEKSTAESSSSERLSSVPDSDRIGSGTTEESTGRQATDSAGHAKDYVVRRKANHIAHLPKDLFRLADLVVKGKFEEEIDTYVAEHSIPVTRASFIVEEIYKGEADSEKIVVHYYGGSAPLTDYFETLSTEEIEKWGLDISDADLEHATVTYAHTKESVSVRYGEDYLLFLSDDRERGIRFILCEAYGACKIKDGLVYDLWNDTYIEMDFLKE
ncbi:MAG: hypothetical protein Q4A41_03520 [Bacillota bacterium]|nr:hypothetical protein [Bacillota bacterium]